MLRCWDGGREVLSCGRRATEALPPPGVGVGEEHSLVDLSEKEGQAYEWP